MFVENLVLYNVTGSVPEPDEDFTLPLGQAEVVREGEDLTIVAHSYTVRRALAVADRLSKSGVEVEVVDLRSLRPLDVETVAASVSKTSRALVAEEGWSTYGVGAEVAARIAPRLLRRPRRAGRARGRRRGADAVCQAARARRAAARGQDRGRRATPAGRVRRGRLGREGSRWPRSSSCRASATPWSGAPSRRWLKHEGDTRGAPATSWPRSRPTRPRWSYQSDLDGVLLQHPRRRRRVRRPGRAHRAGRRGGGGVPDRRHAEPTAPQPEGDVEAEREQSSGGSSGARGQADSEASGRGRAARQPRRRTASAAGSRPARSRAAWRARQASTCARWPARAAAPRAVSCGSTSSA